MPPDSLYLVYRMLDEARLALSRHDPDLVLVANAVARSGGKLRERMVAEGIAANSADFGPDAVGEPVDSYLLPVKAGVVRRMFALLEEHVPCWQDSAEHPVTRPGLHEWTTPANWSQRDEERGWRRRVCARCHVEGVEDSSG